MPPESTSSEIIRAATAWARARDAGDWASARRALAPGCTREGGGPMLVGAPAILADLEARAASLERRFDEVRRESEVEPLDERAASVRFTEYLMKVPGLWHRHRWREEVHADASGAITRIVRRELPGETEALA